MTIGEEITHTGHYESIGASVGRLVDEKNAAYGDSFNRSEVFLKLLYPQGIKPDQYGDLLGIIRIFDKFMRIATNKDAFGEDPWRDIAGYAVLKNKKRKNENNI